MRLITRIRPSSGKVAALICCAAFLTACHAADAADQKPLLSTTSPQRFSEWLNSNELHEPLDFRLRHIFHHGAYKYPHLHRRKDVAHTTVQSPSSYDAVQIPQYRARSRVITALRPATSLDAATALQPQSHSWEPHQLSSPDITDKETVLSFAKMAQNAYTEEPGTGDWQDVGSGFNYTEDFGWENDGIRGHVFADTNNKTIVIAMKGTSLPFIDPIGTIGNDKINDNLFFSCCCGQGGRWAWAKVCKCETDSKVCNTTCLGDEMRDRERYYSSALELFFNVTKLYPEANVWLSGHSLGGAIAGLVGLRTGSPVVAFEAPAEALAASRLGLTPWLSESLQSNDLKALTTAIYHFGHTADDIFMGNCNAWDSICTLGGYAMETQCHSGHVCMWDTVEDFGWTANARHYHSIAVVVKDVIEAYDDLPECKVLTDCVDCEDWSFKKDG